MDALAAVLTAPRQIELRELPIPEVGADDGILEVEACGLCGTDYEQWQGHIAGWGGGMPIIPGHEIIGRLGRVGAAAAARWQVKEGDRVALEPIVPCGHCVHCLTGNYTRCASDLGYGLYCGTQRPPALWGGYATHVYLHARAVLHKLPADVPDDLMTLFNPLSNAIRWICEAGALQAGSTLVIAGPGQRGLLGIVAARQAGAGQIIITGTDADAARLRVAAALGATPINVDREDPVARVHELTGGRLADLVLDVSAGSIEPIVQAVDMVRRGGKIVLAGLKGSRPLTGFFTDKIVFREIQLIGVLSAGWSSTELAIDLVQRHDRAELKMLCTHTFPLEQADSAVRALGREARDAKDVIHVTLEVHGRT
jgi:threonine dehydrogenase-like Zn-dependent dehydrogenase